MRKIAQLFVTTFFLAIGLFAVVGNVSTTAFAAEGGSIPSNATLLTADGILKTIIGNRLFDSKWEEYYVKGNDHMRGTITGLWKQSSWYKGKWWIDGDRLCTSYDDPTYGGCFGVYLSNDKKRISMVDEKGEVDWGAGIRPDGF